MSPQSYFPLVIPIGKWWLTFLSDSLLKSVGYVFFAKKKLFWCFYLLSFFCWFGSDGRIDDFKSIVYLCKPDDESTRNMHYHLISLPQIFFFWSFHLFFKEIDMLSSWFRSWFLRLFLFPFPMFFLNFSIMFAIEFKCHHVSNAKSIWWLASRKCGRDVENRSCDTGSSFLWASCY